MTTEEVKIEMCNRILLYPIAINDTFSFEEIYQKIINKDLPTDDLLIKRFWVIASNIEQKVLDFMLNAGLIQKINISTYNLTNYGIGIRRSGGYFPVNKSFVDKNLKLNIKKFKKGLLKFIKKAPTKRANISEFINKVIDHRNDVKDEVRGYLIYFRDIGIIEIKEDIENPLSYWWGDFLGHNPQAGGKVTELYASLTKDYLNKPWKDRGWNWLWIDLAKIVIGGIIGASITIWLKKP